MPRRTTLAKGMRRLVAVAAAVVAAVALRSFVAAPFLVPSDSMAGTLVEGDYVSVNRLASLRAGDVVVFRRGRAWHAKRIVATAGQRVTWTGARLAVDGAVTTAPPEALVAWHASCRRGPERRFVARTADAQRLAAGCTLALDTTGARGSAYVSDSHVFVVGDHRTASEDSRAYGPVPVSGVVGRVAAIYLSRDPRTGAWRTERVGRVR